MRCTCAAPHAPRVLAKYCTLGQIKYSTLEQIKYFTLEEVKYCTLEQVKYCTLGRYVLVGSQSLYCRGLSAQRTVQSAAKCIGGQGRGGRNLRAASPWWRERGDGASFHFFPTPLLLTNKSFCQMRPWTASLSAWLQALDCPKMVLIRLFCRLLWIDFGRRMHLIWKFWKAIQAKSTFLKCVSFTLYILSRPWTPGEGKKARDRIKVWWLLLIQVRIKIF